MKPDNAFEKLCNKMDAMTVPELRAFARDRYGIVPGAKKRAQLVEAIINAYFGELPRPRKKTGRPPVMIPVEYLESPSIFFDDGKDDGEQKKMEKSLVMPV